MPDREKVIKAWEIFRDSNPYEICDGREFRAIKEPEYCMGQMIEDTIVLLKEQQGTIRKKQDDINMLCNEIAKLKHKLHDKRTGTWKWISDDKYRCSECANETYVDECMEEPQYLFCPYCGSKMTFAGR